MKYIRTKDGIYERTSVVRQVCDNKEVAVIRYDKLEFEPIIKTADTIEELCDEFVFHTMDGKEQHFISQGHLQDVLNNKNINLKDYLSCREIYGAIWTDKGLIYVAKMNDKGELELL